MPLLSGKNLKRNDLEVKNKLTKAIFCKSKPNSAAKNEPSDLKSSRMTDELKRDIQLLNMRNTLDPTHRYKSGQTVGDKKFVQYGTVVESSYEYYSNGGPSTKSRSRSLLDSLMEDQELKQSIKAKAAQIESSRRARKYRKRS